MLNSLNLHSSAHADAVPCLLVLIKLVTCLELNVSVFQSLFLFPF